MLRCDKPGFRCAADPDYLHGSSIQWSCAVTGMAVTKALTDEQIAGYQPWFDNGCRLRELSHDLNELALDTIRAIEGWGRRSTCRCVARPVRVFMALI